MAILFLSLRLLTQSCLHCKKCPGLLQKLVILGQQSWNLGLLKLKANPDKMYTCLLVPFKWGVSDIKTVKSPLGEKSLK